ncbi:MAG: NAD-dependent epimerase/dehydratase family protein [Spirochaetaceae bacterium]|jgi:nucleoside-diphosphate-sugar epimerase|nr:NAD-dependent epimerase/dehydratase family protein [Spirochaetaceae bacterium]
MEKKKITVTGATGYIASWIVRDLLVEGHEVSITVRDKSKTEKYQHLLDIEKESEGILHVFEADLMKEGSFDLAVAGSEYVMHTASPFFLDDKTDPKKNLLDPAVKGTRNVLGAVNRSNSVKRVVLTSSLAAIYGDNKEMTEKGVEALDESLWNTSSSLSHNAYSYSKTEAEKAAWEMAKEQSVWDLVTIHPGFVLGPSLTKRKDSTSIETLLRIVNGELSTGSPDLQFIFSDVRDISKGHILGAFTKNAERRYIVANENGSLLKVGKIIKEEFGKSYKVPGNMVPKWLVWLIAPQIGLTRSFIKNNVGYPLAVNNERSKKELGMSYHSLKDTVIDHVRQLQSDGLIV